MSWAGQRVKIKISLHELSTTQNRPTLSGPASVHSPAISSLASQ